MKKFFVLFVALVCMFCLAAPQVMAKQDPPGQDKGPPGYYEHTVTGEIKYFKNGHPDDPSQWTLVQPYEPPCGGNCDDAIALAESGIMIVSPFQAFDDKGMGWGLAGGKNLNLEANALATGKDQKIWFWKIPGFALADANTELLIKVCAKVFSTGEQWYTGLPSITYAKATGILYFEGYAFAMGNLGCPQFTDTSLKGIFGTQVGAYSLAVGPNGSYSLTEAKGTTAVRLSASDSDMGYLISYSEIEGLVIVKQSAFTMAWVSKDGLTTANFGIVKGGSAIAFGDADILGIRANGSVSQESAAVGFGTIAYGNSSAAFKGASGYVCSGRCMDYANARGVAIVSGYNNIQQTGNVLSVTSHHSAFATTGGQQQQVVISEPQLY